jgi:DUF917 family protein
MPVEQYSIEDFRHVAAGAAVLASGGGGSYQDAVAILDQLEKTGWKHQVAVGAYDGVSNCAVLALMGSPDAASALTLDDVRHAMANTLAGFESASSLRLHNVIPVEIGPINSILPLIAVALSDGHIAMVVDGDGAGRAVPELPQTTYAAAAGWLPGPCVLATDAATAAAAESAVLNAADAARVETLAAGVVNGFGNFSGIALWPSCESNGFALRGHYLPGTLGQARDLGVFLASVPSTQALADKIHTLTGREAQPVVTNFYLTAVTQATSGASLDSGVIRLDNHPDPAKSTESHYLYNLNENLIMYSSRSPCPDVVAPDSICYYSESTGEGFSNALNDLALYFDVTSGKSTGKVVSVLKVAAAQAFYSAPGVVASFAGLLQKIGYAGGLPYAL